jgi:hypothetical protein
VRKLKAIPVNLALLGVSLAVAIAAAEVIVRVAMPRDDIAGWFQPDEDYHHGLIPNFHQSFLYRSHDVVMDVQTNAAGFRDAEQNAPRDETPAVLFLGDSYVFGYGIYVDDRLDTRLRALAGVHTINWGVPGWGTELQARYVRDHIANVRPDVLVLVFCNNDPANDRGVGLPVLPDTTSSLYPIKRWLRGHSHLYRFILEVRARATVAGHTPAETNAGGDPYAISEDDWQRTENGIRMIYGALLTANPEAQMLILAATPDELATREHLAAITEKADRLQYVDLSPYIADLTEAERILPWDGHWSPAVHAAAAQAVWDALPPETRGVATRSPSLQ